MKKKIEIEWNYNILETPENEKVLVSIVNKYKVSEVITAHLWYGRWVNANGSILDSSPYAWAFIPKPAPQPKEKKVPIPIDIKSDLCNRLYCHPDELEKRLADMSVDDIMRELIAWRLYSAAWWDTISRWNAWAKEYKNEKG